MAAIAVAAPYNIAMCPVDASDWTAVVPVAEFVGPTCGRFMNALVYSLLVITSTTKIFVFPISVPSVPSFDSKLLFFS
jgi:hypothetical protein